MRVEAGVRVAAFEILAPIGAGGMGEVYRARDTRLDRDVAIKFLLDRHARDADSLRRFEREARSASALNHPNIVTVFEIGTFEDAPFIAMEIVEGTLLRNLLRQGPLPLRKLLNVATQIAEGLAAAHEAGILHRDLKPENVIVGRNGIVKILDFGLARKVRQASSGEQTEELVTNHDGRMLGTAAYMSPEQISGAPLTFRSDQFSFGAMLYEMATGRRPFARDSTAETLYAIAHDDPEPLQQVQPQLPAPLCWLVERCLAKDADDRYASTRDLARELQTIRDRLPETAPGRNRLPRPDRIRARTAIAASGVAVVVAASVWFGFARNMTTPAPVAALPEQKYVAVLPFTDLSGHEEGQLFSQGFSDSVSARLSAVSGLQIIPPSSAAPLIRKKFDSRRIADELGATLILNASLQRDGDSLRVSYSIVDPRSGAAVAGDAINGNVGDLWAAQDAVAYAVARDLGSSSDFIAAASMAADSEDGPGFEGLSTPQQQDSYLRALGAMQSFDDVKQIDTAIAHLRNLASSAPSSSLVHAALGRAYLLQYTHTRDRSWIDKALRASNRARTLDPRSADVLLTLGEVQRYRGEYAAAATTFTRALALRPDSPETAAGLAKAYQGSGRFEDAEQTFRRAIALRPTWWNSYNELGAFYMTQGRYEDAAGEFRHVIRLNPHSGWGYANAGAADVMQGKLESAAQLFTKALELGQTGTATANLGYCYYYLGDFERSAALYRRATEARPNNATYWAGLADACTWTRSCRGEALRARAKAIELLEKEISLNPNDARSHATLAVCLAANGSKANALRHIERALTLEPNSPQRMYQAARVANLSGDASGAIQWLRRAFAAGYPEFEAPRDPEFRALREHPGFRSALSNAAPAT
ncbi:MAG TPA: protein kinase [Thermoanaerobaculia bacterium]|nr:protein kinase [Thermoanaerobaculia bacterium]